MASALRVQVSPSALFNTFGFLAPAQMQEASHIVVFVSNGPGELATWVRPLAERLHNAFPMRPRVEDASLSLRLVLVPCPNSTGKEASIANKWFQFDRIYRASNFWKLLLHPQSFAHWSSDGVVVFLGGDQFWSVLLSARLGYRHITYAEWVARWPRWNDRIAAMSPAVLRKLPRRYRDRCSVVGDLMADIPDLARSQAPLPKGQWVALLPGSKRSKLALGVPFLLEVADRLSLMKSDCRFLLPIASTTSLKEIQQLSTSSNPIANQYSSEIYSIENSIEKESWKRLITKQGTEICLEENQPAYDLLSQCDLALTTVGANTAELGALGVPMIVLLPTQHMHLMQAWDGFLGVLARLPGLRWCIGKLVTLWRLKKNRFMAWPNISAERMVVPERVGKITPSEIAKEAMDWLSSPDRLMGQKEDLRSLRGSSGAVDSLANEISALIDH